MHGQRRTVGSFPGIVSMMQGPSSSGSDMNQQTSLSHMQNAVDTRLPDYMGSSGETTCLCASVPNVPSFSSWNNGEPSSRLSLHNQVNDDGFKTEHGRSSLCSSQAEGILRPEERQFETNHVIFPVNSNANLQGNQSTIEPFSLQASSSNHVTQNVIVNMGQVANTANRGKGTQSSSSSSVNIRNANGLNKEQTSFGSASYDHVGTSSGSSGHLGGGDNASSSSSLVNWGSSCKRKTLEGTSGQLCTGESSSSLLETEHGRWNTGLADLNASSSLTVFTPSEDITITTPPVHQNSRNEARQVASDALSLVSIVGNVERPLRNSDRMINHVQRQEAVPFNSSSTGSARHHNHSSPHQIPSSNAFNDSLELRLTAGVTVANSTSQSQSHVLQVPGLSGNLHPFPWNGSANPRGSNLSTSYNHGERSIREELNLRIFPRDSTEHPMLVPASSGHDPTSWQLSSGTMTNPGGVPPTSWMGSSSSIHSLPNPSWIVPHEIPTQNQQRLSEFSPWSFSPSISSASGVHNGHSASSSSGPPAFTQDSSNHQPYPRSAAFMDRRGNDVFNAPHSLRGLAVDIEGRRRLISEIRQVLNAMRRGENLRAEDYLLFDPFIYHGMAEMHDRHRDMRLDVDNMSYEELLALEERIGDVSTGLSEDIIMKVMKQRIHVSLMTDSSTDLEPCCICQEEYADGEDIASLDCGHEFHTNCIKQWLTQKNLCPICKTTALAT
ncbi:hypothetical protein L6164_035684 [Bauhinia variegata]|uniref:Uncharacterized protein n=1 Tax=Bauhinia variegata TaxID=167791 RepID=A0ACB9KEV7_BAUVA|nr:hypothetical protein L6164_035684 [Bauhinia variegata]